MATETVFLVNPASAAGSTGRRWPEIAHRAAGAGLSGDALFSERPGHLPELARQAAAGGARLLVVVGGDGSVNEVVNGIAEIGDPPQLAIIPRGTGWDFVRTSGSRARWRMRRRSRSSGAVRKVDIGRAVLPCLGRQRRERVVRERRQRRDERRDRPARE